MTVSRALPILLVLSIVLPVAPSVAQPPSLAGEWRTPYKWVLVVEQEGSKVRGTWKETYRDKAQTCSGIWFEGTISGDRISGSRNPCGGARTEPLDIRIVNQDKLEMATLARGGGLRRPG